MIHEFKTWPEDFEAVRVGRKTHEARSTRDRFNLVVGDTLRLREWTPDNPDECHWNLDRKKAGRFSGRTLEVTITHITRGQYGLPSDLAIMSIALRG